MARKQLTERQRQLSDALAALKAEKALLKQQQKRVAAARRAVDRLCRCDACGAKVLAVNDARLLCFPCITEQREHKRVALLAQHGYGPDGRRLIAA